MPMKSATPACCGFTCISGFSTVVDPDSNSALAVVSDVGNVLASIQGGYNGSERRFVLAICNTYQNPVSGPILIGHGFVLLSVFDNTSGTRCYVYGHVTGSGPVKGVGALMEMNTPVSYCLKQKKGSEVPNPFKKISQEVLQFEKIEGTVTETVEKAVKKVKKVLAGKDEN